jgi:hypothetical protein
LQNNAPKKSPNKKIQKTKDSYLKTKDTYQITKVRTPTQKKTKNIPKPKQKKPKKLKTTQAQKSTKIKYKQQESTKKHQNHIILKPWDNKKIHLKPKIRTCTKNTPINKAYTKYPYPKITTKKTHKTTTST